MERPKQEEKQYKPIISVKDVNKLRSSIKVGDKFLYDNEKISIVKKFRHLVQIENKKNSDERLRTVTYKEILFRKKNLKWINFRKE